MTGTDVKTPYRCEVRLARGTSRRDCGLRPATLVRAECACGHVRERWACLDCARLPGTCGLCRDEGHECPVTKTRLDRAEVPDDQPA